MNFGFIYRSRILSSGIILLFLLVLAGLSFAQDAEWRPVSSAELAQKAPVVEPDADAEALIWEVRIDDSATSKLTKRHYVRVKIFTERGREKYSKFDVSFFKDTKIKDLAARVIRPDGTIVDIKKEDIFDREIAKASGVKLKAKSFAVPNIEPGVIVEYQYRETIGDAGAVGMHLELQRDIPVQKMSYYYKPYSGKEPKYQPYNIQDVHFIKDKGGYYLIEKSNVPAMKEEPRMPPEDSVRPWLRLTGSQAAITSANLFAIQYVVKDPTSMPKYWGGVGAENSGYTKFMNKSSGEIKKTAEELTAGLRSPEEKLRKLYEYCQTEINNTSFDTSLTDEDREKLPQTKSVADVLKRKSGSAMFVDMLFGSMANSIGFETGVVLFSDRSEMFFEPTMTNEDLVRLGGIAIKMDDKYRYFNPGLKFLPFGMLAWYEENVWAMFVGEKGYAWDKTPMTGYEGSKVKRAGRLTLSEDGTLDGEITEESIGQPALTYRVANYDDSAATREKNLIDELKGRLSTAEVSNVAIENVTDSSKPLVKRYKVHVPNYAQKTGKRLFLQPGFFESGNGPVFSSSTRKYDIYFHYPWSEGDYLEITFPAGYELDSAETPAPVADDAKIGSLDTSIYVDKVAHKLIYDRKFHFGGGGMILFKSQMYQPLKALFDAFHQSDSHTITLKQS